MARPLLWPLVVPRLFAPAPTARAFDQHDSVWMSLRPRQLRASAGIEVQRLLRERLKRNVTCDLRMKAQPAPLRP